MSGPSPTFCASSPSCSPAFEGRLEQTPLIRKLTRGRFEIEDYRAFLIGLRQQVKDGALWMSRAASNVDEDASGAALAS